MTGPVAQWRILEGTSCMKKQSFDYVPIYHPRTSLRVEPSTKLTSCLAERIPLVQMWPPSAVSVPWVKWKARFVHELVTAARGTERMLPIATRNMATFYRPRLCSDACRPFKHAVCVVLVVLQCCLCYTVGVCPMYFNCRCKILHVTRRWLHVIEDFYFFSLFDSLW